jgi:hypothetical protein
MIILRIAGGLGNQLFQYSAAKLLNNKKGSNILIDIEGLRKYEIIRNFELKKVIKFKNNNIISNKYKYIIDLRLPIKFSFKIKNWPLISDSNYVYNYYNGNNNPIIIMDGYFQDINQEIFEKMYNIIKDDFINENNNNNINISDDKCIIHIRGNDFIKIGWNEVANANYYKKAINIMKEKYLIDQFDFVTDDVNYAKYIINRCNININSKLYCNDDSIRDFYLIGQYKKRILSSSTFAIWASMFGYNKDDEIVICPEKLTPEKYRKFKIRNEIDIT